ncbi:MAG: hypothetical protein Q4A06_03815 [Cardiobacteriaceae bacterium]|nr:hypothetical protein [Cardiobacteriaceae bacterium]
MRSPAMVVAKRNGIVRFAKYPADFSSRFAVCVDGLRVDDKKALFLAFSFLRLRFAVAVAACRVFCGGCRQRLAFLVETLTVKANRSIGMALGREGNKVFHNIGINKFRGDFLHDSLFLRLRFMAARPPTFFASPKDMFLFLEAKKGDPGAQFFLAAGLLAAGL